MSLKPTNQISIYNSVSSSWKKHLLSSIYIEAPQQNLCTVHTHCCEVHREKAVCAEVSETCLDSPNSLYVRPLFSLPCLKPAHISLPCICFHYWPRPPSLHSLGWQPESTVEQGAYVYTICFSIKEKTCSLLLLIGAANDPIQHLSPASQHKNLYLVLCGEYILIHLEEPKKNLEVKLAL